MPGSYIIRPIEANLTHDTEFIGSMSPYCTYLLGNNLVKGQVCHKGGKHPFWYDSIILPITEDPTLKIELKDKDKFIYEDTIGESNIDLKELQAKGRLTKWYPITFKNKPAGEIFVDAVFQPTGVATAQTPRFQEEQAKLAREERMGTISGSQVGMRQEQQWSKGKMNQSGMLSQFIEQKQVIEPRTFKKQVEVVEMKPVVKKVEVYEPRKIMKVVQYTEAVPVKQKIEVVEPQVVRKEIEIIEPMLVTKEIQVVENVSVKKQVEVIEPRTIIKEIETFEPRTFTKQVEVTEQVPVKKQVTVTEPVTVTKTVEFVEPIITTKTIVKEMLEPVIVDEKVSTSVGPATVIIDEKMLWSMESAKMADVEREMKEKGIKEKFGEVKITEGERIIGKEKIIEGEKLRAETAGGPIGEVQQVEREILLI